MKPSIGFKIGFNVTRTLKAADKAVFRGAWAAIDGVTGFFKDIRAGARRANMETYRLTPHGAQRVPTPMED